MQTTVMNIAGKLDSWKAFNEKENADKSLMLRERWTTEFKDVTSQMNYEVFGAALSAQIESNPPQMTGQCSTVKMIMTRSMMQKKKPKKQAKSSGGPVSSIHRETE